MKDNAIVIVDFLYDFIDGSLACANADNAARFTRQYLESLHTDGDQDENGIFDSLPVIFICDHHPADHCSFKENGGIWPPHCVSKTRGAEIHEALAPYVTEGLTFYKGYHRDEEQYSGFAGKNLAGQTLQEVLDMMGIRNVTLTGIATEYCVRNTAEDLNKAGFAVTILKDGLGYVDAKGHCEALEAMKKEGIKIK